MKLFLPIIFLLSCHFTFAQSQPHENQSKADSVTTTLKQSIVKTESQNPKIPKISTDKKSDPKKSVAEQDLDLEIRAILDYRLNRVLREDLFCLICEVGFDDGQLA